MKKILIVLMIIGPVLTNAQQKFIYEGRIEFERKINVHRQVDDEDQSSDWFKEMVKSQPAFHTTPFSLQFNNEKTVYKPLGELPKFPIWWILGPAKENIVYTDFAHNTRQSTKLVYEQTFLISDSLDNIDWKISDEMRTIAGMECRKAVGRICDSVYVVAFYTDEIPVSGGPESFHGLPGMILGLAIPRLHTTWFATKLQLTTPVAKDFEVPTRGTTKTNEAKLKGTLKSSLKDWGKFGERNTWWVLL
jgi:GLPGLI family protein